MKSILIAGMISLNMLGGTGAITATDNNVSNKCDTKIQCNNEIDSILCNDNESATTIINKCGIKGVMLKRYCLNLGCNNNSNSNNSNGNCGVTTPEEDNNAGNNTEDNIVDDNVQDDNNQDDIIVDDNNNVEDNETITPPVTEEPETPSVDDEEVVVPPVVDDNGTSTPDNNETITPGEDESEVVDSNFMAQVEQKIYEIVNKERAAAGVATLSYNTTMEKYARIKSQDMGDNNYFSHEDLSGNLITTKMKADGVTYSAWGENIAYISGVTDPEALATQFMTNWMNSTGHRENILSTNFSSMGVGVYKVGNKVYATQEFYR